MCRMAEGAMLLLLSTLILFPGGLSVVIQTQHTVTAAVGGEALFCCQLLQPKDVRQVTWQKLLSAGEMDLASSNRFFGQRVNPEFASKVTFKDTSLQNCSIVLSRVEVEDEGCYRCLFNIYPEGVLKGKTCLQLQELHEPFLHVSNPESAETLVECRATGRPAPTVTLSVSRPGLRLSNRSSVTAPNSNGSFTVHASALLLGSPLHGATVGCTVQQQSGSQLHTSVTVPKVQPMSMEGSDKESSWIMLLVSVLLASVLIIFIVVAAVLVLRCTRKKNRGPQTNSTPHKEAQPLTEPNQTPSMRRACVVVRQRTPGHDAQNHNEPKGSAARKLFQKEAVHS